MQPSRSTNSAFLLQRRLAIEDTSLSSRAPFFIRPLADATHPKRPGSTQTQPPQQSFASRVLLSNHTSAATCCRRTCLKLLRRRPSSRSGSQEPGGKAARRGRAERRAKRRERRGPEGVTAGDVRRRRGATAAAVHETEPARAARACWAAKRARGGRKCESSCACASMGPTARGDSHRLSLAGGAAAERLSVRARG